MIDRYFIQFRSVVKRGQDGEGKERSPVPHLYKQSYKANQSIDGGQSYVFKNIPIVLY